MSFLKNILDLRDGNLTYTTSSGQKRVKYVGKDVIDARVDSSSGNLVTRDSKGYLREHKIEYSGTIGPAGTAKYIGKK